MKKTIMRRPFFSIGLAFAMSTQVLAKHEDSLFISENYSMNGVESILMETRISMLTDAVSVGQVNLQAFKEAEYGHTLYLQLPEFSTETALFVARVEENITGVMTVSGTVQDDPYSEFIISLEGDEILGSIKFEQGTYIIEPTTAEDNRHVIHKMNTSLMVSNADDVIDVEEESGLTDEKTEALFQDLSIIQKSEMAETRASTGLVSVLFLYASDVSGANSLASNVVTEFNNALSRSGVNSGNRIAAAGPAQMIGDTFNGRSRTYIMNRMNGGLLYEDIKIRMGSVGADLVVLFVTTDSDINRYGGVANGYNKNRPFALTTDTYALGDKTALHEIGHLLGGEHALAPGSDPNDAIYPEAHGLEYHNDWQTIMGGYNLTCDFNGSVAPTAIPCKRIGYFSNPVKSYQSQPLGNATANMVSALNRTMPIVAGWGRFSNVNYTAPLPGYMHDPLKPGHTLHLSSSGSRHVVYFQSFDSAGRPEWFYALNGYANNRMSGNFYRTTFNRSTGEVTSQRVGYYSLDYGLSRVNNTTACDGVNRALQPGVFTWNINGETGKWCMQAKNKVNDGRPAGLWSNSGVWYEPAISGWGLSLQTYRVSNGLYRDHSVVYYYDGQGNGRWAEANTGVRGHNNVINLNSILHFNGYPRNGSGGLTSQDIGSYSLDFSDNQQYRANVNITYPFGGSWIRNHVGISRLSR